VKVAPVTGTVVITGGIAAGVGATAIV